jgi:hypothetical protein
MVFMALRSNGPDGRGAPDALAGSRDERALINQSHVVTSDEELVTVPISQRIAVDFFSAMPVAANF